MQLFGALILFPDYWFLSYSGKSLHSEFNYLNVLDREMGYAKGLAPISKAPKPWALNTFAVKH